MATFKRILVPVDFSNTSRAALDLAIDLARRLDASLTLMHAWEAPTYAYAGLAYAPSDMWTAIEQAARGQLDETLADLRKTLPGATAVLKRGYAPETILEAATETKADVIVMGTHGRRGLSHMLLGSVAEHIVRTARVPVLTVRGPS